MLAREAEAVLVAVKWNRTSRGALTDGLAELRRFKVIPTGLVLTVFDAPAAAIYGYPGSKAVQQTRDHPHRAR